MSALISRSICRSLKGRFYSAQAMAKPNVSSGSNIETTSINKVKVVTVDEHAPVSRLLFFLKAGSRYEDANSTGVTHLLRHIAYLGNGNISAFRIFKELEAHSVKFNTLTTRDYSIYSVACSRDYLPEAFELVAPVVQRAAINRWEWRDSQHVSRLEFDVASLYQQPELLVMEELHAAAYRHGLGNSLYASDRVLGSHTADMIMKFVATYHQPDRMAVVCSGVESEVCRNLVSSSLVTNIKGLEPNDEKAQYFGGERRIHSLSLPMTYVAVATEGPSLSSKDLLSAALLQQILSSGSSIYGVPNISGSRLTSAVQKVTTSPFIVNGLSVNYTDSGLFGFSVAACPDDIGKVLDAALNAFTSLGSTGVTDTEIAKAKHQLKAEIAMKLSSSEASLINLGEQVMGSEKLTTLNDVLKMVDAIQTADVVSVAKKLVKGKLSMASVGNGKNVPYLENLSK